MNQFGNKSEAIRQAALHNAAVENKTMRGVLVDMPKYAGIVYPVYDKVYPSQLFFAKISDFSYDIVYHASVINRNKWVQVKRIIRHTPNCQNIVLAGYTKNGQYMETPWNDKKFPPSCVKIDMETCVVVFDGSLSKSAVISRLL